MQFKKEHNFLERQTVDSDLVEIHMQNLSLEDTLFVTEGMERFPGSDP